MTYFLNRERMRVVERNDRGSVIYRKRYTFGDEVDDSHLAEGRLDALVDSGALVESEDDLKKRSAGAVPYPGSQVTGAATGESQDHSFMVDDEDVSDPDADVDAGITVADDGDDEDTEMVDEYTSMDYAELQQGAKARNLNAGGSADDLRQRLRDDDES